MENYSVGAKLHIGCGCKRVPDWINADAVPGVGDVVIDLHKLALPARTFAVIYGSHVLEHCWAEDTPRILGELHAALVPGGTLRLSVPDLRLVVAHCLDSQIYGGEASALSVIFGGSYGRATLDPDRHRQAFWHERLLHLMQEAGFRDVRLWRPGQYPEIDALGDYATQPQHKGLSTISLNMEGAR